MTHPKHFPDPMPAPAVAVMTCPRCDREYDSGTSAADTLKMVKEHVALQHPDHDPDWAETQYQGRQRYGIGFRIYFEELYSLELPPVRQAASARKKNNDSNERKDQIPTQSNICDLSYSFRPRKLCRGQSENHDKPCGKGRNKD